MTDQEKSEERKYPLDLTLAQWRALFAAGFSQQKRIQDIVNSAVDGMLIEACDSLNHELTAIYSSRPRIESLIRAIEAGDLD